MYARAVTLFARATRPLERVDGAVNRLNDLTVRLTPRVWWPAARPTRDRPLHAGQHAAYLGWSAFGFVAGELLARRLPEDQRPTGRRLGRERAAARLGLPLEIREVGDRGLEAQLETVIYQRA